MSFLKEFDHLKIQMKDIILATNNFDPIMKIGHGGFGSVYKGELSYPSGRSMVAFKRLDRTFGQGSIEFWKEIMMLSKYKHENLVSLMHFCIVGDGMILVYEYASRGSLDRYLKDPGLTWIQRLKICVEVARALHYLHDPISETQQQRLLHRDIKSSNILLDENWIAKVSDFGLSKFGPANQAHTFIFSNGVGTRGYCDPLYLETGFLSKESDVYSFGVVLFEVICGRLCVEYHNGELLILVPKWRECYEEKRLDEIIFLHLREQMDHCSLTSFLDIAYRCVKKTRDERPMMAEVLKELEFAHQQQEIYENIIEKVDYEQLFGVATPYLEQLFGPLARPSYGSQKNHIFMLLLKGILVDNGRTWVSINKEGEICEMISATKCMPSDELPFATRHSTARGSRFSNVIKVFGFRPNIKLKVKTQFLTPHVTYTINLVYGYEQDIGESLGCVYKVDGETYYAKLDNATGWQVVALYEFTSYQNQHDFIIEILRLYSYPGRPTLGECFIESIEFLLTKNENSSNTIWGKMVDQVVDKGTKLVLLATKFLEKEKGTGREK